MPVAQETSKRRPDRRRRRVPRRLLRRPLLGARRWSASAQVGSLLATLVLETVGTQEYELRPDEFVKRLAESYGDDRGRRGPAAPRLP